MLAVLWLVIVSSLLCLIRTESNENCGTSVIPTVTRGREIVKGEYPWLAALYKPDELNKWTQFCGGALISPSIVITAAHCLVTSEREVLKPENVKVGLGKLYRDYYRNEDNATIANVSRIIVHRHFHGTKSNYALDVGLLKLNNDVKLSAYVLPVCYDLDTVITVRTGALVHAAGWGTTENGTSSEKALGADLSFLNYSTCLSQVGPAYQNYITHEKICSVNINSGQVDRGDSGGPLTHAKDGRHFVIGVVSIKIIDQTMLSVFTDLSNPDIHAWIKKQTTNLILPAYSEGHLLVFSTNQLYIANAGSSRDFEFTDVDAGRINTRPAVDCVTRNMYWLSGLFTIRRGTVDGKNVIDFYVKRRTFFYDLTLDWIDKKLYFIQIINKIHSLRATSVNISGEVNEMKIDTIISNLTRTTRFLVVHPTLRKIYLLTDMKKMHSLDLDSSTPTPILFHEESKEVSKMVIDWQTNDLCWLSGNSETTTIKCKNLVTEAITVMSVYPKIQRADPLSRTDSLVITPHNYYWRDQETIFRRSRSTSRIDYFNVTNTDGFPRDPWILGIGFFPEKCPELTPPKPNHQTTMDIVLNDIFKINKS